MPKQTQFSQTYYDKANEADAFKDYAPFRYGQVESDEDLVERTTRLRKELDPILVDIVDGGIDLLFCNEDEARAFTGLDDRSEATAALADRVPRVCVTLGAEGTLIIDGDGAPQIVEGFDAQAIDTTGAGDTFAGGVLYGLTHGLTLPQSAVLGNYGAAIVVSSFGPRLAAPLGDLIDDILARPAPPVTSSEVRR